MHKHIFLPKTNKKDMIITMDNKNKPNIGQNNGNDQLNEALSQNINLPPEIIRLNSNKKEFEHPGEPVGVYLADKEFRIISLENDETQEKEYYLIDPNPDQTKGEDADIDNKKIDPNTSFMVGRESNHGFNLPRTVSRAHAEISRIVDENGDRLCIKDLGSSNGTELELPRVTSENGTVVAESNLGNYENLELSSEGKAQTIADFKIFTEKYQSAMDEAYDKKDRKQVSEIIYSKFYSLDEKDKESLSIGDEELYELSSRLHSEQEKLSYINAVADIAPGSINTQNSWYYYQQGDIRSDARLGRLYFNIDLAKSVSFMKDILTSLGESYREIDTQIKIPKNADRHSVSRRDKMVMYFYDKDEKAVLECIEKLHNSHEDYFNDNGTPRFSETMVDSQGKEMKGVGFGQEPYKQHTSFGAVRSNILADVFWDAKGMGHQVSDTNFNFDECYIDACNRHYVDPNNPAFNANDSSFQEIKNRLSQKEKVA